MYILNHTTAVPTESDETNQTLEKLYQTIHELLLLLKWQ